MGVRILYDRDQDKACLFDSVTDTALGPVFYGLDADDQAEHFREWHGVDKRNLTPAELRELHARWTDEYLDPGTGELTMRGHSELDAACTCKYGAAGSHEATCPNYETQPYRAGA